MFLSKYNRMSNGNPGDVLESNLSEEGNYLGCIKDTLIFF